MLSVAMQIQAVADLVAGLEPARKLKPSDFEDPWDICFEALVRGPKGTWPGETRPSPAEATNAITQALGSRSDRDSIMNAIVKAPGSGPRHLPSFAELAPDIEPFRDLWPNWIPLGMLTLIGAAPGTGKTFVALDLARRIINGEPWPDGSPMAPEYCGRPVIYVDAESSPQLLKARLSAWQFDWSKLLIMQPRGNRMLDFSPALAGRPGWRERNEDRDRLIEAVAAHRPALVVIDSFSMVSSRGENAVEDVRDIMGFLGALARDYNCSNCVIHHLRKRSLLSFAEEISQDDFRGSTHLTAVPRSVLALSLVQKGGKLDRNGPRKLEMVKTNLGRYPNALKLEFTPLETPGSDGSPDSRCAARLDYTPLVAEDDRPGDDDGSPPGRVGECARWLLETLAEAQEPLTPGEIVDCGAAAGYHRMLVYKAREHDQQRGVHQRHAECLGGPAGEPTAGGAPRAVPAGAGRARGEPVVLRGRRRP